MSKTLAKYLNSVISRHRFPNLNEPRIICYHPIILFKLRKQGMERHKYKGNVECICEYS